MSARIEPIPMTTASDAWIRPLRITATVLAALLVLTILAFFDDPPGVWVIAGALVGLVLLILLVLHRPSAAVPLLWALTIAASVGWLSGHSELEALQPIADAYDRVGIPAEMILTIAMVALAWRRAIPAGMMICVYWIVVPWLAELLPPDVLESDFADFTTGFDAVVFLLLPGPLFIIAGLIERRGARPPIPAAGG